MVGWHHLINRHELKQTAGNSDGQEAGPAVHAIAKSQTQFSD